MLSSVGTAAVTVTVNCSAGQQPFLGVLFPLPVKYGASIEDSFLSSFEGEAIVISFCKLFSDCDESFLFVLEQRWLFDLFYDRENSYLASKNLFVGKIKMVQSWAPEGSACTHHQHTDTSRPSPPGTHTSVEFLHSLPQPLPAHPYLLGAAFYPDQETFTWVHLDQTEENSELQKEDLHVLKFPQVSPPYCAEKQIWWKSQVKWRGQVTKTGHL